MQASVRIVFLSETLLPSAFSRIFAVAAGPAARVVLLQATPYTDTPHPTFAPDAKPPFKILAPPALEPTSSRPPGLCPPHRSLPVTCPLPPAVTRIFAVAAGPAGRLVLLQATPNLQPPKFQTLHVPPFTLHPTPHTLQPTPYALHLKPHTLHPTPYAIDPIPQIRRRVVLLPADPKPRPLSLLPKFQTPHPSPYILLELMVHTTPF